VLAKIDPADQLADDEDIDAAYDLRLERRQMFKARRKADGPEIGAELQLGAKLKQGLLWPPVRPIPFGTTDGAKQNCVSLEACFQRLMGQWIKAGINCSAPHPMLFKVEAKIMMVGEHGETLNRLIADFRPYSISWKDDNAP
jgi:hypothetical protein